ncbi:MAG: hypothetical protein EBR34_08680 [Sphingomonadaceae bacterium]|nr:hypothetical protein [Sphingomonadaceae bacterium]
MARLRALTNKSSAQVVRDALKHYAAAVLGGSDLERRRQTTNEFLFLVADQILADANPQLHDTLMSEASRRTEELYARISR